MDLDESELTILNAFMGATEDLYEFEYAGNSSEWTSWLEAWRNMKMVFLRKKQANQSPKTPASGKKGPTSLTSSPSPRSKEQILFRSSETYRHAYSRCYARLEKLDKKLDILKEELEVCRRAEEYAKTQQLKYRVNVKLAEAMHAVRSESADIKALGESSKTATEWTDALKNLQEKTACCRTSCDNMEERIKLKENELRFLEQTTPEQFMKYLSRRGLNENEDEEEDEEEEENELGIKEFESYFSRTRIPEKAKSSVLEKAAKIKEEDEALQDENENEK